MTVATRETAAAPASGQGARPHRRRGGVWFAATSLLLAGLSPLLLMSQTPLSAGSSSAWVWAAVLTVGAGLRYAWLVEQGGRRLFEQVVWLFVYVFLGLAPLAQMRSGDYPGTTPDLDTALNSAAMLVVAVGTGAFALGVALGGGGGSTRPPHPVRVDPYRVVVLSAVALAIASYYAARLGIDTLLATRSERNAAEAALWANDTARAVIEAAATFPLLVAFAALCRLRQQRRTAGQRGSGLLAGFVLVVLAVVVNPVSTPRYVAGTAGLAVLVALGAAGPRWARTFAVALAAGLVLVFPYADLARNSASQSQLRTGPAQALSSGDFDAVDQINNTVAYVREEGHTFGRQLSGAALFWVPRAVWPSKPVDTGILLADFREYSFSNLSAPLWAELFIDGGWPLLAVGMAAVGVAVRRLDQRSARAGPAVGASVLAGIVPFYLVLVLRGSLLQSMAGLTVLVLSGVFVTRRAARGPRTDRGAQVVPASESTQVTAVPNKGGRPRERW